MSSTTDKCTGGACGSDLPIKFHEHLQLSQLNTNQSSYTFQKLTIQSDLGLCIRETTGDKQSLLMFDLLEAKPPRSFPNLNSDVESVIINPDVEHVIALRAKGHIQIFNTDQKSKMADFQMPSRIVFWKWINKDIIGVVTDAGVYHCHVEEKRKESMFFKYKNLDKHNIINYTTDPSMNWLALTGIAVKDGKVNGTIQLHCLYRNEDSFLDGHAVVFTSCKMGAVGDQQLERTLMIVANCNTDPGKLSICELGNSPKKEVELRLLSPSEMDFPVAMHVGDKYGVVYILTKCGYIYIYDIESAWCIYSNRISQNIIFASAPYRSKSGVIGVNRSGQVLSVTLHEENIISHIKHILHKPDLAKTIHRRIQRNRLNVPCPKVIR